MAFTVFYESTVLVQHLIHGECKFSRLSLHLCGRIRTHHVQMYRWHCCSRGKLKKLQRRSVAQSTNLTKPVKDSLFEIEIFTPPNIKFLCGHCTVHRFLRTIILCLFLDSTSVFTARECANTVGLMLTLFLPQKLWLIDNFRQVLSFIPWSCFRHLRHRTFVVTSQFPRGH